MAPPDWIAELANPVTGEVKEVRAVLQTSGVVFLSPANFRSFIVHSIDASSTVRTTVLVLFYKPGNSLCLDVQQRWFALGETIARLLNGTDAATVGSVKVGVFRVNSFADQDELDSGRLEGTGGDGAEVVREHGMAHLLEDVPSVAAFERDAETKTGIRMRGHDGVLDAQEVLRQYTSSPRHGERSPTEDDNQKSRVGEFSGGLYENE
jgi:hypothetical protein